MKFRKNLFIFASLGLGFPGMVFADPAHITSIDFKTGESAGIVTILSDDPIVFSQQEDQAQKQVVIELKNAVLSKEIPPMIDASAFGGRLLSVFPVQVAGSDDLVRVTLQLKSNAPVRVSNTGNLIEAEVPNEPSRPAARTEGITPGLTPPNPTPTNEVPTSLVSLSAPATSPSKLEEFEEAQKTQRFVGKPITLQLRDVPVADVLRLIGEASGFNVIIADDVKGKITLSLEEVPWDQALDLVLHTMKLGSERNNNILRVMTLKGLREEKEDELQARKLVLSSDPKVTRIFPISYAKLEDLKGILEKSVAESSSGGMVQIDFRTNSLVVRDSVFNLERMKKLIDLLDTQTPQVLIEAKIVEASDDFSKSLGGNLGFGGSNFITSFAGGNPVDQLLGSPGVFASGSDVASASRPSSGSMNGTFGFSPTLGFLPGISRLNAVLRMGERKNEVKIVTSPKTVVMNKEQATIVQGIPVLMPAPTTAIPGVGTATGIKIEQANISLDVKPTITNDASVMMDLLVKKDIPWNLPSGQQAIGNRSLKTMVLVDSGSTLVIGGVYSLETRHVSEGFPFLKDIPIIGFLFGSETNVSERSELFIFITPRILSAKDIGVTG